MVSTKLIVSAIVVVIGIISDWLLNRAMRKNKILRGFALKKFMSLLIMGAVIISLLSMWSIDAKDIWLYLTSVLGLVAIGFFAVWSLLSNTVAGMILLISKNVKIGDDLVIMPDEIKGKVKRISPMFTILKDEEGYITNVPNSLMFQKYVKKKPRR